MKKIGFVIVIMSLILFAGSCKKDGDVIQPVFPGNNTAISTPAAKSADETTLRVYYNGSVLNAAVYKFSADFADEFISSHKDINSVFAVRDLQQPQEFHPVIESVKPEGANSIWREVLIEFTVMSKPHQFYSLEQIAEAEKKGDIKLINTTKLYHGRILGGLSVSDGRTTGTAQTIGQVIYDGRE